MVLDAGQHNLSIALRHLLQQIVDSTNAEGQKHTDMTLPHDGYIQKLSWYFECDKCHYKAFYSLDMETHKMICTGGFAQLTGKKRKLAAPRRVTSSTHPPNTDSDQDSEQSVGNLPHTHPPVRKKHAPSMPQLHHRPSHNVIAMEPRDIEFDANISSPDHDDLPTIPAFPERELDFEPAPPTATATTPHRKEHLQGTTGGSSASNPPSTATAAATEPAPYYDQIDDITEIKLELDADESKVLPTPGIPTLQRSVTGAPQTSNVATLQQQQTPGVPALQSQTANVPSLQRSLPALQHASNIPPAQPNPIDSNKKDTHHRPFTSENISASLHLTPPNLPGPSQPHTPTSAPPFAIGNVTGGKKSTASYSLPKQSPAAIPGAKAVLSINELERRVLRAYGKVVNYTQVKYTIFNKFYVPDLRERVELAMARLSQKGYGYLINRRFYKNPFLTPEQLAFYHTDWGFYQSRLAPTVNKHRFSIAKSKADEILKLYNSLFKVNETSL